MRHGASVSRRLQLPAVVRSESVFVQAACAARGKPIVVPENRESTAVAAARLPKSGEPLPCGRVREADPLETDVHHHERLLAERQALPGAQVEDGVVGADPGAKADGVGEPERRVVVEAGRLAAPPCLRIAPAEEVLPASPPLLLDPFLRADPAQDLV